MARRRLLVTIFLLFLVSDVRTQFFDFFGISPLVQNYQTPKPRNTATTKSPRIESVQMSNRRQEQTVKKITSVTYTVDEDDDTSSSKEKGKRKHNNNYNKPTVFTLAPLNFNIYSTTAKPVRKTTKTNQRTSKTGNKTQKITSERLPSDYDLDDYDFQGNRWFDRPVVNNINDFYPTSRPFDYNNNNNNGNSPHNYNNNQVTTKRPDNVYSNPNNKPTTKKPENYNNNDGYSRPIYNNQQTTKRPEPTTKRTQYTTKRPYYNNQYTTKNPYSQPNYNNEHTTKNPYYNRPGVKPAVPEALENRPPITNRPVTSRPFTTRPTTKVTKRPVIVPAKPTDAGTISFPEDELSPQVIIGPDEDFMSEVEKQRYIEIAERMCDKYKSLNTMQLQAIPLIPSPEPVQVNVSSCAPVNIPLVVGGKVVRIEEFPHMALVGWLKLEGAGYSWKCGGSLISDQYVLTAAHCSFQERDNTVVTGPPRAVQLGSSYLDDSGALVVRVSAVVRHPKYKSPRSYYDVALLKLAHTVSFSQVIKPACLGVPPPVDQPIIATGWGRTERSDQSLELRSVSLPIWDIDKCADVLGTSRKLPSGPSADSQVCAGEMRGGKDTCQGDSGGPAQIQDGCIWRVVAVTSLGRSCGAPNTPGLYAKVPRAFIAASVFGGKGIGQSTTENNNQQNYNHNQLNYGNNQGYNHDQNQNNHDNNQGYNPDQNYNSNGRQTTSSTDRNYQQNYNPQDYGRNYNDNQNGRRQISDNNQQNYDNQQNHDNQEHNNQRRDNSYNNQENYDYNHKYDATTVRNHRNVNVNQNSNTQNTRNYNTDDVYHNNNQPTYHNYNSNYNQRRDYRDNRNNENYRRSNFGNIHDSSRVWFT